MKCSLCNGVVEAEKFSEHLSDYHAEERCDSCGARVQGAIGLLQHIWRFSTAWYGTVRYGTVHFWGVFHWVLYLVPDTFLVPLRSRFHRAVPLPKRDV